MEQVMNDFGINPSMLSVEYMIFPALRNTGNLSNIFKKYSFTQEESFKIDSMMTNMGEKRLDNNEIQ